MKCFCFVLVLGLTILSFIRNSKGLKNPLWASTFFVKWKVEQILGFVGGVVAAWLVCSTPERGVRVGALAGDIVLCSWVGHLTLTVPLSIQVYKWVPVNCGGGTCNGLASRPATEPG